MVKTKTVFRYFFSYTVGGGAFGWDVIDLDEHPTSKADFLIIQGLIAPTDTNNPSGKRIVSFQYIGEFEVPAEVPALEQPYIKVEPLVPSKKFLGIF